MLTRLWRRTKSYEQLENEAKKRLRIASGGIEKLHEIVDTWLNREVDHEWFEDEYRRWLATFSYVDAQMWTGDRNGSRELLRDLDVVTRRALAARHAMGKLRAIGDVHISSCEAKQSQYARSLESALGPPAHLYPSYQPPKPPPLDLD